MGTILFSRDIYPNEPEFKRLLEMVHAGIRPTIAQLNRMGRLDAVVDKAPHSRYKRAA